MKSNLTKTPPLFTAILIIVLGGLFFFSILHKENGVKIISKTQKIQPVNTSNNTEEWKSLTEEYLFKIVEENGLFFEPEFGIHFEEAIDLTGDGIAEGIFSGNGGNNGVIMILMKNTNEAISIARQKEQDGSINPVYLVSVGRVMVKVGYELLPLEHGFYTISYQFNEKKSLTQDESVFDCGGVSGYVWNNSIKLFEFNSVLSRKYEEENCK